MSNISDQNPRHPLGEIAVAVVLLDGRYFIACETGLEITQAYLGLPKAMKALKVHEFKIYRDGGSFFLTTNVGSLAFDYEHQQFAFEWFKDEQNGPSDEVIKSINKGKIEWGDTEENLDNRADDKTLKTFLFPQHEQGVMA